MATGTLTGQTIANTYKSLLKITGTTAGGETLHATTLKVIEDGDGNPFPFSAATDAVMINSTNRLEFGDNASYIHQSADGVLDLVSDTEIELTATTIDINGAVDMSSTLAVADDITLANNKYYQVKDTAGSNIRVIGLANSNDVYVGFIDDATGTGSLYLRTGGTNALTLDNSQDATFASWITVTEGLIVNEGGGDNDVRIESQNQANMFRIDASTDRIGIRESTPLATLHIKEGDSGLSSLNGSGTNLFLEANGANAAGMTIASGNTANGYIIFGDSDSNFRGAIQYDHSSPDKMHLVTAGSQRLSIDQNGRVGIGDSSPGSPLDVKSGEAANTANFNSTSGATNITFESSGSLIGQMEFASSGTSQIVTRTSATLALGSNNVKTLYITDDDMVGISTTTPQSRLQVGTGTGTTSHFGGIGTSNTHYTGISLGYTEAGNANYRKTMIVQEQIGDGSARGHLHFLVDIAADGNSAVLGDAKLKIHGTTGDIYVPAASQNMFFGGTKIKGEHDSNNRRLFFLGSGDNYMTFGCYDDNSYGYIENYNNSTGLYIFTGAAGADLILDSYGAASLKPYGDEEFDLGESSFRFDDVYASNGTIQTSDKRMKDNIKESSLGLDFINKLNPVEYKWKDYDYTKPASPEGDRKEEIIKRTYKRTHYGLVAQEVEKVLTDSGLTTEDFAPIIYDEDADRYGMRYTEMIGILIKGMQELSAKVEALENA